MGFQSAIWNPCPPAGPVPIEIRSRINPPLRARNTFLPGRETILYLYGTGQAGTICNHGDLLFIVKDNETKIWFQKF